MCVAVAVDAPPPKPPPPPQPWFSHEDYTDRHGSFLQHNGQWYYASNDRSHSGDTGHEGVFRDTVICYIHFRASAYLWKPPPSSFAPYPVRTPRFARTLAFESF